MSQKVPIVRFTGSPGLPGVEVYRIGLSGPVLPRSTFGTYAVGTVLTGEIEEFVQRKIEHVGPGSLGFLHPDDVFGTERLRSDRFEGIGVLIDARTLETALHDVGARPSGELHWKRSFGHDPAFAALITKLATAIESNLPELELHALFDQLVGRIATDELGLAVDAKTPAQQSIQRVKDHLRQQFASKIMLEDLESVSGLSRFHLVRRFTAEVGLPPHTYQVAIRVERARALIRRGASPITVATQVGFADQSHLTRHFKRRMGITPGAYAQLVAGKRR